MRPKANTKKPDTGAKIAAVAIKRMKPYETKEMRPPSRRNRPAGQARVIYFYHLGGKNKRYACLRDQAIRATRLEATELF